MEKRSGLIPKEFISQLLQSADIVNVISGYVDLKKSGKNYQACCPFHDEKTPSFTVNPDKQFFYCFGCGEHGNAINFVMKHTGLPFTTAVEEIATQAGLAMPAPVETPEAKKKRAKETQQLTALQSANAFYNAQLSLAKPSDTIARYLKARNISAESLTKFDIGYAPKGWDHLYQRLLRDKVPINTAVEAGLIIQKNPNKVYDRFRDRLIFPIKSRSGEVIGFGGSSIAKRGSTQISQLS